MTTAGVRAIAFDLDGTLVDSRRDLADSANELLAAYGGTPLPLDAVTAMVGGGARLLVRRALAASGVQPDESEALDRFLGIYGRRLMAHTTPYEGIPEILENLAARAPLAVLTNKPERLSRELLDGLNLSRHFRWLFGGDSSFPRKPDPAALRHLMHIANATPASTVLVGDSMVDVETAREAGTAMCLVGYGFGHVTRAIDRDGREWVAPRPADLTPLLDAFLERVAYPT
jgi:phosphoglycolate phosphatase